MLNRSWGFLFCQGPRGQKTKRIMGNITILILREGGVKCSRACRFYEACGFVRTPNGPLQTRCGMTTQKVVVDCDSYSPDYEWIEGLTDGELEDVLDVLGKDVRRVRKEFAKDHEEIHPVGW